MTDPAYERATRFDDPAMPPGHRERMRVRWGDRVGRVWSGMVGAAPQNDDDNDDSVLGNEKRED